MMELGFIKKDNYATTMKQHSKSKRHKHYCQEDKYEKYLKWNSCGYYDYDDTVKFISRSNNYVSLPYGCM
jgi:hypothetical protein